MLNDRMPCQGHSPDLVAGQLADAVTRLGCESVLLDFQRPPEPESATMARIITQALSCPVAVTEDFAEDLPCPVFLSPGALHLPLAEHLARWKDREIWLEAALCQETLSVTALGVVTAPIFPTEQLSGGFYDEYLRCHYRIKTHEDFLEFTFYDTPFPVLFSFTPINKITIFRN